MSRPPLGLHVEATAPDGSRTRWGSDSRAQDRPQNLSFRTARMTGFADASVTLSRRIDQDYVDLHLLDDIAFVGDDGSVAYEGRMTALPRSMQQTHQLTVQAAGHMAHTSDRKFTEIYVDRDLSAWAPASRSRRMVLLTVDNAVIFESQQVPDAANGLPALSTELSGPWGKYAVSEAWYDAGVGALAKSVYYDFQASGTPAVDPADANWTWRVYSASSDASAAGGESTANLRAASGTGYFTPTTARRYVLLHHNYAVAAGASGQNYPVFWRNVAVYGDHGLTIRGTAPGGVYASDVITHIAANYCPQLNTAGVQDTTYPIPHLAFKERATPYDAFLRVNAFHLWNLAVWEDKTLHYGPVDLADYDWQVRLSDHGVSVDLQGDSTEQLANGIVVQFQNVATGVGDTVTPDDDTTLKDTDPENPANQHGLTIWTEISLSAPTTRDAAIQMGRAALAEFTTPRAPGTITVHGHIRDHAGHWVQGWKVRAGDTIAIVDHPNDRPRLISETSWSHDSKTLTVSVEGQPRRLDAVLDRLSTSMTAAGLG